jgi:kinesin family protein 11
MEGKNGPFCRGLSESSVSSADDLLQLMRKAQTQRQVGETNMNKQSSRSHCIFTLRVEAKRQLVDGSVLEIDGKLHCVDLAGSECAKSADLDAGGGEQQAARERERMNIKYVRKN